MKKAVVRTASAALISLSVAQGLPGLFALPAVRRFAPALLGKGHGGHIALTFDDGPDPDTTGQLLEVLERLDVRCTFFVLGQRLLAAPQLGVEMAAGGHEIAVHGWTHANAFTGTPWMIRDELRRSVALIHEVTGQDARWYRPPHGVLTASAWWAARQNGLRPVLWSAWGRDWSADTDARTIADTVLTGLIPGGTVLLHDSPIGGAGQAGHRTRQALPRIISECRRRGYGIGPLAEHWV